MITARGGGRRGVGGRPGVDGRPGVSRFRSGYKSAAVEVRESALTAMELRMLNAVAAPR